MFDLKLLFMKKLLGIFALLTIVSAIFFSCAKYEDGPAFSLKTKKARLAGDWQIEKILVDDKEMDLTGGDDSLGISMSLDMITFTFEKDGTGKITFSIWGFSIDTDLTWEFGDGKETLAISIDESAEMEGEFSMFSGDNELTIQRLTDKELWLKYEETVAGVTVTYEYQLAAKE